MPFQEDFSQFLDIGSGFASEALITPAIGDPYKVKGIISNEYSDIDEGMAGVAGSTPYFECAEKDVAGIEYDDFLQVKGIDYRIKGIKPDGSGWMVLILEAQE